MTQSTINIVNLPFKIVHDLSCHPIYIYTTHDTTLIKTLNLPIAMKQKTSAKVDIDTAVRK